MRLLAAASDPDATSVGNYAFYGCSGLESALIGSKVNEIGGGAFGGCSKLKSITVEAGNANYKTEDGLLLTADGKVLISGAGDAASIIVPSGVTNILEGAFAGFDAITNVTLSGTVQTIGEAAFSNATELVTMTIPTNVISIGQNAFSGTALATVYVPTEEAKTSVKALVDETGYQGEVNYVVPNPPSIPEDPGAIVTGDVVSGYTITPSTTEGTVEVTIPSGVDAEKVTVEVPPTATVKPNGANVAVVVKDTNKQSHDISEYLTLPSADESGAVNLANATLKEDKVFEETTPGDNEDNVEAVLDTAMDSSKNTATVKSAKPGLWYSMEASNDLSFPEGDNTKSGGATMATSETVNIAKPAQKPSGNAVFYRIKVSSTAN